MINLRSIELETITITAVLETALCVGAGGSSGSLADKTIVRTADGHLLIPASQFKGRLRHECEKIARGLGWPVCQSPKLENMCPQQDNLCLICQIFGNPRLASRVDFDDLISPESIESLEEVLRPRVTINRRRQTAEDRKLYFLETSPAALKLQFQGFIHIYPEAPPQTKPLLLAALKHIHALGGSKSTGLGWLTWQLEEWGIKENDWKKLLPEEVKNEAD